MPSRQRAPAPAQPEPQPAAQNPGSNLPTWSDGAAEGAGAGAVAGGLLGGPVGAGIGGLVGGAIGGIADWWEETLEEFRTRTFPPLIDHQPSSGIGMFDVHFTPADGQLRIVLKVGFDFVNGTAANVAPGFRPEEFQWTDAQKLDWKTRYIQQVQAMWSGQHGMKSTKPGWEAMRVATALQVVEDAADPHFKFTVSKYPDDAGMDQSSICPPGTHHGGGNTCPANPADAAGNVPNNGTAKMDSNDMRPEQKLDWSNATTAVQFRSGSELDATAKGILDGLVPQLQAANAHAELTGHASSDRTRGTSVADGQIANMDLARARSAAVAAYLQGKGISADKLLIRNEGQNNASPGLGDRRVDIQIGTNQTQNPALHETGHMLGLGDEYGTPGQPVDAKYAAMVQAQTGQVISQANDASAMSMGSTVRVAHYSSFLEALKKITGMAEWSL